jgi:acetolactate synthase I/II/III large subunit
MNGAESLVRTLLTGGVDTCFTNPGTSEMHIVAALDGRPEMRCVLGLFEGVVTGAADGYARMSEKPACTLLHLGPGLANGLANLHNAKRAQVPIVSLVGQHATNHLRYDTPLASDIEAIARPYSAWLRTSRAAPELGRDTAEAIIAARTEPGRIATLIVPADAAWSEGGAVAGIPSLARTPVPAAEVVEHAAAMLRSGARTAILLGGKALYGQGLALAGRIATATGAKLLAPYPFTRIQRGAGLATVERIPYILEQAIELLKEFRQLILVGTIPPVAYFAHPTKASVITPSDCEIHALASPGQNYLAALEALAASFLPHGAGTFTERAERPCLPTGAITPAGIAATIGALLPGNAIVIDESMTSGRGIMPATRSVAPHDWLGNTGGSIGIALPLAVGAAVACPDRRVLCLSADGSSMYTLQGLWTIARESLSVTTIIFSNRVYGVLKREFANLGLGEPGPRALGLFEIGRPDLDWVSLAKGMGVPGARSDSLEAFAKMLRDSFENDGPMLIELPL